MVHRGQVFGCALGNDVAALVASAGTEVYQPVGALDEVEVVFDQHHTVPGVHETMENAHQVRTVLE